MSSTTISDLVLDLGTALDSHDFDALRDIYTTDATVNSPKWILNGVDEIVTRLRDATPSDERTQHINCGIQVRVTDTDTGARATCQQLVYYFDATGELHRCAGVHCEFTATKAGEDWRIAHTSINPLWVKKV